MVSSGARGNKKQIVQLGGMKGLVVNPTGQTIELPIKANFREGFSVLEYFISTHGARKGKSDTALKTSDSEYLTRRLVDVAQDVVVSEEDCGDFKGIILSREESKNLGESFADLILGRVAVKDITCPKTKKIIVREGEEIDEEKASAIQAYGLNQVNIRSVISCRSNWGVCQKCYGRDLARGKLVVLGEAVGVMAAQSIGEPGTQLTMRTFHTGGIAEEDITQGLPRVEELFEARRPKGEAVIAEIDGQINISQKDDNKIIKIIPYEIPSQEYPIKKGYVVCVKDGQKVSPKKEILKTTGKKSIYAKSEGITKVKKDKVVIVKSKQKPLEYQLPAHLGLRVKSGDKVKAGQQLTEGNLNLQKIFKILGEKEVQKYIVCEAQKIYASQGQTINSKHIEVVVRQMFSKVRIKEPYDTDFLPGEIVDKTFFCEVNNKMKKAGGKPATCESLLLGITKVALKTSSFLSAASFQETTRVLVGAAVTGSIDFLRGLKENVIIGRLIPGGTGFRREEEIAV
jgi:DNA-directed RNA polymerase subunit beta'